MSILELRKNKSPDAAVGGGETVLSTMDRRIEQRLITPQRIAIVVGALALVAITTYAYMRFGMSRTLTVGSERLTVAAVAYGTFREYIPVTGNVVPRTTVYLDAIEGGQVTEVYVEEGAFVTAGEPLVEFKNTNLQIQVVGTEAQAVEQTNMLNTQRLQANQNRINNRQRYIENEYQIERLTRQVERRRSLAGLDLSELALEDLESELAYRRSLREPMREQMQLDEEFRANQVPRMESALEALTQRLEIARQSLANLVITAPITGQLTLLEANMGESKSPGQRVGQIDEVGKFKVSAFIDEFYLSRVTIGQTATVELDRKDRELEVFKVYPDVRDRQFEVDLQFVDDAAQEGIRRGQTLRMRLEIGQPADTLVLANGAFYDDTGGQWVFVVDPSGDFAEKRSVRFGRRNPEGIEVLDGLREGEEVITSSYESLMNFDRIQFRTSDS